MIHLLDARRAFQRQNISTNLRWSVSCDYRPSGACRAKREAFHRGDGVRLPWVKWYPANWSSEPGLRLCCAATRGIWTEALNVMMLYGSDRIQGSVSDLARICICEPVEMMVAIGELSLHRVANVFQQNVNTLYVHNGNTLLDQSVNIIIVSRRRARELEIKELRSKAGKISATQRQQAKEQEAQHRSSSSYSSSSLLVSKRRPKSLEEVLGYASEKGISESDATAFFDSMEAGGWTRNGKALKDWEAHLRSYKSNGYLPSQKQSKNGINGQPPMSPEHRQNRINYLNEKKKKTMRLIKDPNNPPSWAEKELAGIDDELRHL